MKKRVLALFLSLVLCVSLLPAALAAGKTYEEAVQEFREEDSMREISQTFDSNYGTIFIYGTPNPHGATGSLRFITKAPCAKGEGETIGLPTPRHSITCATKGPQTAVLSEDGKTFTYTYHYDEPLTVVQGPMLRPAGDFIYTLDLTTGEVTENVPTIPEDYNTYAAALERVKNEEGWVIEQTLDAPACTVLLRYFQAEDGRRSYFLVLVWKLDNALVSAGGVASHNLTITRDDGTGQAGFPVYYTHRAPDTLTLNEDKTLLTYTYSESLNGGPDSETLELATGLSSKTNTLPTIEPEKAPGAINTQAAELAGKLRTLGLFLGDEKGNFNLDKAPTRVEALVMLIRALGEEPQAKAAGKTHPFTDVPAWADGYVSWGYTKGYTKGVSATEFGANTTAGADMYLTFMLRALGYTEGAGGQFTWDQPYLLAYEAEILPFEANYTQFTRGDAVMVTSAALWAALAGSDKALADQLVEQGSFTAAEFSAQFPQDPFSWEHSLKPRVAQAMDAASPTGQTDRKRFGGQEHIMTYAVANGDVTTVYVCAAHGGRTLTETGDISSSGIYSQGWQIDLTSSTGEILSCAEISSYDKWPSSAEEPGDRRLLFYPSLYTGVNTKLDALMASGQVTYIPPTYDEAVAELRGGTGHHNEQTFETDECTIFVYDRGGFMNAPTGAMTLIYKPGSALGEGTVIGLPHAWVKPGLAICYPADTMALSEDGKTFTYTYYREQDLGEPVQKAGIVTYTVDLPTGKVTESWAPHSYATSLTHVTRKRIHSSGEHSENREVIQTLESNECTVVLTRGRFVDKYDDYILSLVYKPGSTLGDGTIQRLLLPSTVYDKGYPWYNPTDQAPDSLTLSEDGRTLTYVYRFDEALEDLHEAGTYTYTVDLATGELSVTHTGN